MLLRIISLILPVRIKKPDSLICTIFCGQALKMVHSVKKVCLLLYKQFCMSALSVLLQDLCSWETLASVSPIQTSSGSRSKKTKAKCITIRSELRETRCKLDSDRCQATRRSCQICKKESREKKWTVLEGHSQICNLAVIELTGESERILYPSHRLRDILKRDIEPHTETRRQDKNETP